MCYVNIFFFTVECAKTAGLASTETPTIRLKQYRKRDASTQCVFLKAWTSLCFKL